MRCFLGVNKPGGVGFVKVINENGTYFVHYVLGGKEDNVEEKYISIYDSSDSNARIRKPVKVIEMDTPPLKQPRIKKEKTDLSESCSKNKELKWANDSIHKKENNFRDAICNSPTISVSSKTSSDAAKPISFIPDNMADLCNKINIIIASLMPDSDGGYDVEHVVNSMLAVSDDKYSNGEIGEALQYCESTNNIMIVDDGAAKKIFVI